MEFLSSVPSDGNQRRWRLGIQLAHGNIAFAAASAVHDLANQLPARGIDV
jgi:hypothetical protein